MVYLFMPTAPILGLEIGSDVTHSRFRVKMTPHMISIMLNHAQAAPRVLPGESVTLSESLNIDGRGLMSSTSTFFVCQTE